VTARPSSLFETLGLFGGELRLWDRHMARLSASMRAHGDDASIPSDLRERATSQLASASRHDVLVVERALPTAAGEGLFALRTRSRTASPWARALRGEAIALVPTVVHRGSDAVPAEHKARPRAFYDAVLAQAQQGGADDGVVVGADGAVLETAVGNLWLHLDSVWVTPSLDGRVLPGIARALLLERAARAEIPVAERPCSLSDLHRADAICLSNAAFGVVPARLRATEQAELHSSLRRLWRFAVGD
jgi:branched-subunit amino acid aminotransferase/4-amino-4-deoxychorismate lyase